MKITAITPIVARFGNRPRVLVKIETDEGITGWYFRVLAEGLIVPDETMHLIERPNPDISIAHLWAVETAHRPDADEVRALSQAVGLSAGWAQKLRQRADWLARHAESRSTP